MDRVTGVIRDRVIFLLSQSELLFSTNLAFSPAIFSLFVNWGTFGD